MSCSHFTSLYTNRSTPQDLKSAQQFEDSLRLGIRASLVGKRASTSKANKAITLSCTTCSLPSLRTFLCLTCGSSLCGDHLNAHDKGHSLLLDSHSIALYCRSEEDGEGDYVYDNEFERMKREEEGRWEERCWEAAASSALPSMTLPNGKENGKVKGMKSIRTPFVPTTAPTSPFATQSQNPDASPLPSSRIPQYPFPRGLRNLGQTCYMSVVLQSFLYNPILRSYFLGEGHNRGLCERSLALGMAGNGGGTGAAAGNGAGASRAGEKGGCLGCELDRLFEEAYNGDSAPFGPTNFLYSIWQSATELSGYAQQDSHEFLISTLNLLHTSLSTSSVPPTSSSSSSTSSNTTSPNPTSSQQLAYPSQPLATPNATPSSSSTSTNRSPCQCIIHQTFSGSLNSQVACGKCGNLTKSEDPFLDLSLDLRNMAMGTGGNPWGGNTLEGCLKRFTSPEELGEKEYSCSKCGDSNMKAKKQLSIKSLPPVLCIQLKRFEHSNVSQKIDVPITFPSRLNMRAFTTAVLARAGKSSAHSIPNDGLDSMFEYELSSVICHEGQINNGHYTNFCWAGDEFFCFDDDKVKKVSLAEVMASKAYLLTYVKKTLAYAA